MNIKYLSFLLLAVAALTGCTEKNDEPGGGDKPHSGTYQLSGKVEKGPFVRGSSVSVQPLNESMTPIGTVFSGEISDDTGSFDLGKIDLASQFVRIAADGYYFNEISGDLSLGQLHLIALADLSDRNSVNVNIITHLKSARIQNLMRDGNTFAAADRQAQKELLTQFGLQNYESTPAETMSVSAGTDGSGVLIAISSLVLVNRSDAEITEYISALTQDLADDGVFTDDNKRTLSRDRSLIKNSLEFIADNITSRYAELGKSIKVPDLRYFIDWNGDGIAGNEIADNIEISLSQNEITFDKNGGAATIQITSNIPLSLEPFKDPYGEESPGNVTVDNIFNHFFETNNPIKCVSTYENNVLTIKVDKTQSHINQTDHVFLYDLMGTARADIKVILAGDPAIPISLSDVGKQYVSSTFNKFSEAVSWMYYMERGYTGMYQFHDVRCPLNVTNSYNNKAFQAAYSSIRSNALAIKSFSELNNSDANPYFILLNAITYTEMLDKWGNICIFELTQTGDNYDVLKQEQAKDVARYIENSLDNISSAFREKSGLINFNPEEAFSISKDVWRMAKANIHMFLNEPSRAMPYLEEIVNSGRYTLSSGNEYDANSGTILFINVPNEVMSGHTVSYYSYADALLLLAECYISSGNETKATALINQVAQAKNMPVIANGNLLTYIEKIRKELFIPRYFAFQKRHSLGNYESYQTLWPLPQDLIIYSGWSQNPGYNK